MRSATARHDIRPIDAAAGRKCEAQAYAGGHAYGHSMLLRHLRRGSGEPLVLIHPLGGELVVWEPVLDRLAAERDAIAVDMPGFGGSPPLADGTAPTPQALASSLAAFLDELGIERAHLAGNSLGGWVALELAKMGRARSVAGLSTAGFWKRPLGPRPTPIRRIGRTMLPIVPVLARTRRGRRLLLNGTVARPELVPPAAAARLVRAYVTAPGYDPANAAMRSAVFEGIEQIREPVTLAWGELDRVVGKPRTAPAGVRTVLLPGCGHVPTWDDPELVARVLLEASSGG
jgi:pimeloyl-ACP methyl ester carboxylesterase